MMDQPWDPSIYEVRSRNLEQGKWQMWEKVGTQ
jgi:hypothetical protein